LPCICGFDLGLPQLELEVGNSSMEGLQGVSVVATQRSSQLDLVFEVGAKVAWDDESGVVSTLTFKQILDLSDHLNGPRL